MAPATCDATKRGDFGGGSLASALLYDGHAT
jgi:hypothetical protein